MMKKASLLIVGLSALLALGCDEAEVSETAPNTAAPSVGEGDVAPRSNTSRESGQEVDPLEASEAPETAPRERRSEPSSGGDEPLVEEPSEGAPSPVDPAEEQPEGSLSEEQDDSPSSLEVSELISEVSDAVCDLLTRCCSETDRSIYFEGIAIQQRIIDAGLDGAIPPAVAWQDFSCKETLPEVFEVQPFGAWVDAVEAGLATYHAEEGTACLEALEGASCGAEATDALFDSSCFGFSPPMSSLTPRRMFTRTAALGETCMPLTDGVGGAIFGTCDPTIGWCCRESASGSCGLSPDSEGTCVAAGGEGDSCGFVPTMSFCQTGLYCGTDSCVVDALDLLQLGDPCFDDNGLLGDCVESYCDMFDSRICEPLKSFGEVCEMPYECISGACDTGTCNDPDYCAGL